MLLKIPAKSDFYIAPCTRFTVISEALNYDTFFAASSSYSEIFLAKATESSPSRVARH
jgi:hypothetical protein